MKYAMKKSQVVIGLMAVMLAVSCEFSSAAVTITQWTFGPATPSSGTVANSPAPTTGTGTAITLGMSNSYNAPGSIPGDDFLSQSSTTIPTYSEWLWRIRGNGTLPNGLTSTNGWALYNITGTTAHDGAPQYSQGMELDTSTLGYSNIKFSFDWYSTTQGIRDMQFQYCLNTSSSAPTWVNLTDPSMVTSGVAGCVQQYTNNGTSTVPTPNYVFVATPNDFYSGSTTGTQKPSNFAPTPITVDLSTITGANNDPNLGIRLVSAFDDTGKFNDYVSATAASSGPVTQLYNNSSGNWRFNNLTFAGNLTLNTNFSGNPLTWAGGSGTWNTDGSNLAWLDSGSNSVAYAEGSICTFGNVSSGTSTITVTPAGVAPGGIAINNPTAGTGYVFTGGAISGTGAMYLQSGNKGFVSLSGTNTYSGGTQVSGGTLIVAGDASLGTANGAGGAVALDNGSTLQLASNLLSGRIFEIGANGGVLNTNGLSFATSGNFFGGGAYTQLGGGTVTLNGQSVQLSGSVTVSSGALVVSGSNAASFQSGGTFNGNLVINGPTLVNFDKTGSSGSYGGSGQIQVAYPGRVTAGTSPSASNAWAVISNSLPASQTLTGGTVASAGTINNNIVLNPGGSFTKSDVTQPFAFSNNPFIAGIGATAGGTATVSTLTIAGNISGNSDLVLGSNVTNGQGGSGYTLLSGSNSWAGATLIDGAGLVQLGSTAALPPKTDVIFGVTDATAGTLDLNGNNETINSLSAASGKPVVTSASKATLTISGTTTPYYPYTGTITGKLGLTKSGSGGLALTGKNTYSGATAINQGTVTVSNTSSLGTGGLTVQSGASLIYSGAAVSLANSSAAFAVGSSLSTGGTSNYGTLTFTNAAGAINLNGGSLTYDFNTTQSDLIAGAGTLNLSGAGLGSIVINLNTSGQMFNSYPLFTFGTLSGFNSGYFTMGSGTTAGYTYGFTTSGGTVNLTITGTGSNNLPTRQSLAWATGTGTWDTSAQNWGGTTTFVNGEPVTFGEPTADGATVSISNSGVTPLAMTISNSSKSYTFTGGPIMGTTSLSKINAGMVTLATANSYMGGTSITGGTLVAGAAGDACLGASSGAVTLGTSAASPTFGTTTPDFSSSRAFTINNGTFLATTGTSSLSGAFTIASSATFNKTGTGTLALRGSVSSGAGSMISAQAGNLAIVPDTFTLNGAFDVAPGATLTLNTTTPTTKGSSTFQLGAGTIDGNLVVTDPLTLSFGSAAAVSGAGAIQFQNMQSPAQPTHFTTASGQGIQVQGGPNASATIVNNIELNSLNSTFYKTSVSQSGSTPGGTGFVLGNGSSCSFFWIYPGAGNTMNINSVISGNCDVQFGPIGGGSQANTIFLNRQNTYTGVTMFEQGVNGVVYSGTNDALPRTTDLMFAPVNGNSYQQKLDLSGNTQTVASLSYWAYANVDAWGNGYSDQIVIGNSAQKAVTLMVSGTASPSRPYGGIIGDNNGGFLTLVKDGPNTLWLNGDANSYEGGTIVNNGVLLLTSTSIYVAGFGDVTLNGGTLQGVANLQNNFVVNGGTVRPGTVNPLVKQNAGPGTLSVTNNATVSGGANFVFDIGSSASSLLAVNGVLSLPTTASVTITPIDEGGLSGIVPLMTYESLVNTFSDSRLVVSALAPDGSGAYNFANSSGTISLVAPTKLTWLGSDDVNPTFWDTKTTANFKAVNQTGPAVFNANLATYGVRDHVTFDNSSSGGTVQINGAVDPLSLLFSTSNSYDLTGGTITGTTSLVLSGGGHLTLDNSNTYTGGTYVESGTLTLDSASAIADGTSLTVGDPTAFSQAPIVPEQTAAGAPVAAVPEPGTVGLLAAGLALIALRAVRRRKK